MGLMLCGCNAFDEAVASQDLEGGRSSSKPEPVGERGEGGSGVGGVRIFFSPLKTLQSREELVEITLSFANRNEIE